MGLGSLVKKALPIAGTVASAFTGNPLFAMGGNMLGGGGGLMGGTSLSGGGGGDLLTSLISYGLSRDGGGGYAALEGAAKNAAESYGLGLDTGRRALGQLRRAFGLDGQDMATHSMREFFITPEYRMLFGDAGTDPNMSPEQRFQTDPGYQFGLKQGQKALEASAAAKGNLLSGNTLRAVSEYGQDYGWGKFNDYRGMLSGTYANYIKGLGNLSGYLMDSIEGQNDANMAGAQAFAAKKLNNADNWNRNIGYGL